MQQTGNPWYTIQTAKKQKHIKNTGNDDWTEIADVPEYGEAVAMKYTFQAMMWGLLLFYAICLLIKQIRTGWRAKRGL